MKKLWLFLFVLFSVPLMAQTTGEELTLNLDILYYYGTPAVQATLIIVLTGLIKKYVLISSVYAWLVSVGVGLFTGALGYVFHWGMFANADIVAAIELTAVSILAANNIYSNKPKEILAIILSFFKPKSLPQ